MMRWARFRSVTEVHYFVVAVVAAFMLQGGTRGMPGRGENAESAGKGGC